MVIYFQSAGSLNAFAAKFYVMPEKYISILFVTTLILWDGRTQVS